MKKMLYSFSFILPVYFVKGFSNPWYWLFVPFGLIGLVSFNKKFLSNPDTKHLNAKIIEVNNVTGEYLFLYMSLVAALSFGNYPLLPVVCIFYLFDNNAINPVWLFFGYKIYEIDYSDSETKHIVAYSKHVIFENKTYCMTKSPYRFTAIREK